MVYGAIGHFQCFCFYELLDRLRPQLPDDGWCRHSVGAICHDSSCTIFELLKLVGCCSATNTPKRGNRNGNKAQPYLSTWSPVCLKGVTVSHGVSYVMPLISFLSLLQCEHPNSGIGLHVPLSI